MGLTFILAPIAGVLVVGIICKRALALSCIWRAVICIKQRADSFRLEVFHRFGKPQ